MKRLQTIATSIDVLIWEQLSNQVKIRNIEPKQTILFNGLETVQLVAISKKWKDLSRNIGFNLLKKFNMHLPARFEICTWKDNFLYFFYESRIGFFRSVEPQENYIRRWRIYLEKLMDILLCMDIHF